MNTRIAIATALLVNSAFAQEVPVWSIPSPLPTPPTGVNSAIYPMPRFDWFQQVQANNEKAQKIASTIELVFDGDSITYNWQRFGKELWTERYEKLHAFNFGIGGDRTENILWRLSHGQMNGIHPKLIALMIGTNNSNSPEEVAEGVKAIVSEYQKLCPKAVILLQAIFPRGEQPTDPARAKLKAINQIIARLDDGQKVIYIDFSDKFVNSEGKISREVMGDFTHPTLKGYKIWAESIQAIIERFFPTAGNP